MAAAAAAACGRWLGALTGGPAATTMALPDGLYDQLLTDSLSRSLAGIGSGRADLAVLQGAAGGALAEAVTRQLAAILDDLPGDGADKAQHQLALVNDLLDLSAIQAGAFRLLRKPVAVADLVRQTAESMQ